MENSESEEAKASNNETDKSEEKKGSIQIVKLEFTKADDGDTKETKHKNPQDTSPIPG